MASDRKSIKSLTPEPGLRRMAAARISLMDIDLASDHSVLFIGGSCKDDELIDYDSKGSLRIKKSKSYGPNPLASSLEERQKAFKRKWEQKKENIIKEQNDGLLKDCSFKPQINPSKYD